MPVLRPSLPPKRQKDAPNFILGDVQTTGRIILLCARLLEYLPLGARVETRASKSSAQGAHTVRVRR